MPIEAGVLPRFDPKVLIIGKKDGSVVIFGLEKGQPLKELKPYDKD